MPERDYVEVALFNIVFHNKAFGRILNLFEAFGFAGLYKERWKIQLFFRWIKQNLKIKSIYGTH